MASGLVLAHCRFSPNSRFKGKVQGLGLGLGFWVSGLGQLILGLPGWIEDLLHLDDLDFSNGARCVYL